MSIKPQAIRPCFHCDSALSVNYIAGFLVYFMPNYFFVCLFWQAEWILRLRFTAWKEAAANKPFNYLRLLLRLRLRLRLCTVRLVWFEGWGKGPKKNK